MTDEGSRAVEDDGASDGAADDGVAADERTADAIASGAAENGGADDEGMDPELEAVVEYELEDLEDDDELPYPSMDDPVAPQSIDLENAAFVVLGVVATVGLVAYMVLGVV
jgi:hypothetical protein